MFKKLLILSACLFFVCSSIIIPNPSAATPGMKAPSEGRVSSGEVIETMNASGYTYMLLASSGRQIWVAIPETAVEKGAVVNYFEGMVMENFTSKTLNKTFEAIVFSSGLSDQAIVLPPKADKTEDDSFASAVKAEQGTRAMPVTAVDQEMSGGSAGAIVPFAELAVEKATGANGYTVGEIFEKAKDLSGKKVQIRGKVVKFSPLIMGKNWIHLQDGTGNPMNNSHDLVITTVATAEVNSVITIEGTLSANKDFGAGYKYAAIVEQATLLPLVNGN